MAVSKSRASAGLRTGRVTASQALRVARSFGVTLDLSNDLELAGKWKHGWIPLDAVAAAVKAKRYHGGGGESVRGKARGGSLVESMRRPSTGTHSVQGEAARAEMARRAGGGAAGVKPVRGKVKRYVLERTLPDGSVKRSEPVTLAEAEQSMMGVLHYNQGVSRGEAGRLAPQLRHANVGEHVEAHGYKFRLVAVK